MGSRDRDKVRPTPPPHGPALVRPVVGVLLLALGGVADAGCTKKGHGPQPPMPDPTYGPPPMPPPPDEPAEPEEQPPMPEEAPMPAAPMPEPE